MTNHSPLCYEPDQPMCDMCAAQQHPGMTGSEQRAGKRVTHRMTNRITIGTYLRDAGEPRTPREIGAATGLDLTTVSQTLYEMKLLGLAQKTKLIEHAGRQQKSSPVAWTLTGKALAA